VVRPRLACAAASPATALSGTWEAKYPAIVKLWESAWAEFERCPRAPAQLTCHRVPYWPGTPPTPAARQGLPCQDSPAIISGIYR